MPDQKEPIPKFAARIKQKYPEYKDVNDTLLVQRIVEKYPEYRDSVDLSEIEKPVKKKESATPSASASSDTPSQSSGLVPIGTEQDFKDFQEREKKYTEPSGVEIDPNDPVGSAKKAIIRTVKKPKITSAPISSSTRVRGPLESRLAPVEPEEKGVSYSEASKDLRAVENWYSKNTNRSIAVLSSVTGLSKEELYSDAFDNQIKQSLQQGNATHRASYEALQEAKKANKVIQGGGTLEDMAVRFAGEQDPMIKKQIENQREQFALEGDMFGEGTKGRFLFDMMNNAGFQQEIKQIPQLAQEVRQEAANLSKNYPSFGKMYYGNMISQEMEKMGISNSILNVVTKDEFDKVVLSLKEKGEISLAEEAFINENLRSDTGLKGLGKQVIGRENISTPGLIENIAQGGFKGLEDLGKGIAEISGLRDAMQTEQEQLKTDTERLQTDVNVRPEGVWHEITQTGGKVMGQSLSIAGGGGLIKVAKLAKNPAVALGLSGGIQAYANYAPEARMLFPGEVFKQEGYATIMAGIEALTENRFRDDKVLRGLMKDMKPSVVSTIEDFTTKKISAAAAEAQIESIIKRVIQKAPEAALSFGKAVSQNVVEEVAASGLGQVTKGVFEGRPMSEWIDAEELAETVRMAAIGSPFIATLATRADLMKNRGITSKQIMVMARNPEYYAQQMQEMAKMDEDLASQLPDKLQNLQYATDLLKELDTQEGLSEKQKAKFLLTSLDSKIKQENLSQKTDPILRAKENAEVLMDIQENEKIKQDIVDDKDDGSYEGDRSDDLSKEELKAAKILAKAQLPEQYQVMAEQNPVGVLQDISKQAQNLNDNFEPNDDGLGSEDNMRRAKEMFGEKVVEEAVKLYPKKTQPEGAAGDVVPSTLKNVYEENKNISEIGNIEEYQEYLKSIFPDSKMKEIVWHSSPDSELEFKSSKKGIYFSQDKDYWSGENIKSKVPAILNVKNPKVGMSANIYEGYMKEGEDSVIRTAKEESASWDKLRETLKREGKSTEEIDKNEKLKRLKDIDVYEAVVFDPDQIHILGSKKDIENFKIWKQQQSTPTKGDVVPSTLENSNPFEGSVIRQPLFHASKIDFDEFKPTEKGVYFTSRPDYVGGYMTDIKTGEISKDAKMYEAFLDVKNPLEITYDSSDADALNKAIPKAKKEGNDAVILKDSKTGDIVEAIVFKKEQIKIKSKSSPSEEYLSESKRLEKEFEELEKKKQSTPTNEGKPKVAAEQVEAETPKDGESGQAAAESGKGAEPPISTTPPTDEGKGEKKFDNNPKAILNRVYESQNIPESVKEKFRQQGLTYTPKSHEEARVVAREMINEFGTADAVSMAEAGRFDGDVNSMVFAEAIDRTFQQEQSATTQEEKIKFAEQWADYTIRYDESARSKGRFISAIYDFYRKSPLGVILAERAKRDEAFREWFDKKEKPFKEVFEELQKEPEFQEILKQKVSEQTKQERAVSRMKRRKKIEDIFDKAKIKGDTLNSSIIPPQIWNAAVEVMKQATLAGESIVDVIQKGVDYVKANHTDAWDEKSFRDEWLDKLGGVDSSGKMALTDEEKKNRILEKFRKKLSGLTEDQKEEVIRKSFKKLVDAGALNYDDFKKIIADVLGLGEMTSEEVTKLTGFVKDMNAVQDLSDALLKDETKENLAAFEKGVKKAEESATKLAGMLYTKPNVSQRLRTVIQLNTLGIVSLIKNPFYNIFHQLFVRLPKGVIMTGIDQLVYGASILSHKAFGTPLVKPDVNIFMAQRGYWPKAAKGGKEAVTQVFTGLTNKDYFQKEVYSSQIKPFLSIRDLWAWGKGKKELSRGQWWDKFIQAFPLSGMSAEVVARMLNIGDKPFRYAAEAASAQTIGRTDLGLKGFELEIFMRLPKEKAKQVFLKKGMSEEVASKKAEQIERRIIAEGEEAVFQQANAVSDAINKLKQQMSSEKDEKHPLSSAATGAAKLFGTLNMPFVKTPVNVAWEVFNLVNPEVALLQSITYGIRAAKTNSRADYLRAKKWLSHAATGWALLSAAGYLASIGAASGDDEDEPYKPKEAKGKATYERPKSINMSKLWRVAGGGTTQTLDGDMQVDLSWFGAPGMIMNMQANKYENMTEAERNDMSYLDDVWFRMNRGTQDALMNSVFQGTISAVDALRSGNYNQWLTGMMNVGTNVIEPATLAQISRASRPYDYKITGDDISETLQNNFKSRFFGLGGNPPTKVNVWGEEIKRDGSAADITLRMLGVKRVDGDIFAVPVFNDFKRTGDSRFFPPSVSNRITVNGESQKLSSEEYTRFETLVGQARRAVVAPFINGQGEVRVDRKKMKYTEMTDEQKVEALKGLYADGYEDGKKVFIKLYPKYSSK